MDDLAEMRILIPPFQQLQTLRFPTWLGPKLARLDLDLAAKSSCSMHGGPVTNV